jgi:putative DNA primase/helicase
MSIEDAIQQACSEVGIAPPKAHAYGRWLKADAAGKNGKGDGRLIINDTHVTAWNWQTGERVTVGVKGELTKVQRQDIAKDIERQRNWQKQSAANASIIAQRIASRAVLGRHPYLQRKGLDAEKGMVIPRAVVTEVVSTFHDSAYLTPAGAERAIVIPARIGTRLSSLQLIWEDGTKKFLFGGQMERASHRLATGRFTWFCEGFATGLSARAALRSLNRSDGVLVGFSAYNVALLAKEATGRRAIITDHDKPLPQFGGLGTGEYYAKQTGVPYLMPPQQGDDINDVHRREGIFEVQRLLSAFLREVPM